MKLQITDVVVHRLSVPLPRPVRTARHDHAHADTVAVEMRTDAGLVGAGYCFAFGARRARALAELVEDLAEVYVGRAPAPQARHAEAWRALNFIGHAGPSLLALAALDTACWDLAARAVNLPLFRFLGGDRTRVPTYASSGLWIDDTVDALVREAEDFRTAGHRAMKMRVGRANPDDDVERVRIVRGALGEETALLADVNQGWDETTAIRVGRRLEEHDLYWLEEPLPYDDLAGCARVAAALAGPAAHGRPHRVPARGRALPRVAATRLVASVHRDLRAPARRDAKRADPRAHGLVGAAVHGAADGRCPLRGAERETRHRMRAFAGLAPALQGLTGRVPSPFGQKLHGGPGWFLSV